MNKRRNVALLTEGVDRNHDYDMWMRWAIKSPSSRRAWIEISTRWRPCLALTVALLTEGVDRNKDVGEEE